jgi:hypothetical protein
VVEDSQIRHFRNHVHLQVKEPATQGSISGGSSIGASTGTTITENSVKQSQKMNIVSVLVLFGLLIRNA